MPGGSEGLAPSGRGFGFTPVNLLESYEPPNVSSASPSTQYIYDVDRELKTVTRPDGATLAYGYDSAGRLQTTTIPQGTVTLTYDPTTGQLQSSTAASGEAIQYAFDGFLKTGGDVERPGGGHAVSGFRQQLPDDVADRQRDGARVRLRSGRVAQRSGRAHTDA